MENNKLIEELIEIGYQEKLRQIKCNFIDVIEHQFDELMESDLSKKDFKNAFKNYLLSIKAERTNYRPW